MQRKYAAMTTRSRFFFFALPPKGLGIVHVLTGPDHLSALATLSAVSDFCTSFSLGVRWGLGHSTGLLLVGVALIIRDYAREANGEDNSDVIDMPDAMSHFFESIVGFFMLFLGAYGFRRAFRKRHEFEGRVAIPSVDPDYNDEAPMEILEKDLKYAENSYRDDPHLDEEARLEALTYIVSEQGLSSTMEVDLGSTSGSGSSERGLEYLADSSSRFSARTMAVLAGIIHGLAGPGGVLGVIPAVQLHDWKLATLYLSCFCVSSTLTMGCFASFYGMCSSGVGRRTKLEFQIHLFSASLCILVGITWLVLLAVGKLEDVFP